jgi:protein TonB
LIYQVQPAYPPLAKQTRTQGVVLLEAVIDRDGSIQSLRVISGHPLLTGAAVEAVKQWRYRPTLLNGEPIEVITTVTVTFTLR